MNEINIIEAASGAIRERIDYELQKVIENINDVNTKAGAKRKITVTLELLPDEERQHIVMQTVVKSSLQPTHPIKSSLYLTDKGLVEMTAHTPGQYSLDGEIEDKPNIIPIRKAN